MNPERNYDVLVCGGGPAGCAAAAAAAGHGARTLLVESGYMLGGMGTSGLVTAFAPFGNSDAPCYGGIALEVLKKMASRTYRGSHPCRDWITIDPEYLKRIYDDLVIGSGAELLFGSRVCALRKENGRIAGVTVSGKWGLSELTASVVIDATGDADLSFLVGVPCRKGDDSGALQPASLCFVLAGVHTEKLDSCPCHWIHPESPIHKIVACGDYPDITDCYMLYPDVIADGVVGFNAGHLPESDGTDPLQVSRSVVLGRKIAEQLWQGLKRFAPEVFGESVLVSTAPALGVRESRRIVGEYVLNFEDYAARRSFADGIARNCYAVDIHTVLGKSGGEEGAKIPAAGDPAFVPYGEGESHGIPYRSLIPLGIENLLAAGRCISCDRIVNSSIRVMPCCLAVGQATGTAAALAVPLGGAVRKVDTETLRRMLAEDGAVL